MRTAVLMLLVVASQWFSGSATALDATPDPASDSPDAPQSESRNARTRAAAPAAETAHPTLSTVSVVGKLDEARNQLSPDIGSSEYIIDRKAIEQLPLGDATPLNQVLLQAPGVVNDSYGQLHVRGDHADLQYRIDGVIIPESISGFGQTLDTRLIDTLSFLTGALPAQYGYRTAGIVDVTTRTSSGKDTDDVGGDVGVVGGSFGTFNPSADIHGKNGAWSYFFTASYLQNDIGIENPTSSRDAIHDHTNRFKAFGDVSYLLDDSTRLSFLFGANDSRFEIPNNPAQLPAFQLDGIANFDSRDLDERQTERTRFGTLSLQGTLASTDYQISLGQRYTSVDYQPDPIGDLVFNGVAGTIARSNRADTLQADFSTPAGNAHTIRYGLYVSDEHPVANDTALVFPADADGNQTRTTPIAIVDNAARIDARTYGFYLQDEWQIGDKLTVNYGARADKVDAYVSEGQVSPRLGLIYRLSDTTTLHAGYARYFTPPPAELIAPSDIALFQGTTNALPTHVNAETLSERSNYFDAGISQKLGGDFTLGLDAYDRKVTNLLDEGQFGAALIFSPFNYAQGKVRGVELTANYDRDNFSAYANVSSSRAEGKDVVTGQYNFEQDELDYIATHWVHLDHDQRLASSGGVSYLWNGTRLGADYIYGSGLRADFANSAHLPQYYQINLSADHKFALAGSNSIDVTLAALNVTDRSYLLRDGSGIGVGAPQYGPRRGVFLGVNLSF